MYYFVTFSLPHSEERIKIISHLSWILNALYVLLEASLFCSSDFRDLAVFVQNK